MKLKTHSLVTLIKVFNTNYEVIVNYIVVVRYIFTLKLCETNIIAE